MTSDNKSDDTSDDKSAGGMFDKRTVLIAGMAVLAVGLAAVAYITSTPGEKPEQSAVESSGDGLMAKGPLEENILGTTDAPVTIIEYSSLTCPHCANFHKETLPALKKKYIETGKARYILREFPLDNLALAAFMIARCAGPKKYFPLVEELYAQQKIWAFGEGNRRTELLKMAKHAGFTEESFDKCLADQKLIDGLRWVKDRGNEKFEVNSTPTFFVNGEKLKGSQKISAFEKVIEPLL